MRSNRWLLLLLTVALLGSTGWNYLHFRAGSSMTADAEKFLETLYPAQREQVVHSYDSQERLDWHFIPKDHRKGLQIREMNTPQREAAQQLLRSCLSQIGYNKATAIMQLEHILDQLEGDGGSNIRDTERYYFSVFGEPAGDGQWGLSIEGHHLSLNFVVKDGEVISSTPAFFAANPAIVKNEVERGKPVGTRVLAKEEQLAFDLVNMLSDEQREKAVIADQAPREIRGPADPQPPQEAAVGIAVSELEREQRQKLRGLIVAYLENLPEEVNQSHRQAIRREGFEQIHFAWAGAREPGIGHYYRIQGPSFLIEFVNTQPDPAGNPANHIHCVLRDMHGDFAIPISN